MYAHLLLVMAGRGSSIVDGALMLPGGLACGDIIEV